MKYIKMLTLLLIASCGIVSKQEVVSDAELESYAKSLVDKLESSPDSAFYDQFDVDYMFDKMYDEGLSRSATDFQVKRGFASSVNNFGKTIARESQNGSYELMNARMVDGEPRMLFRLYGSNGLNYHDYLVVKKDGQLKLGDAYIYTTGENLSKTMSVIFMGMIEDSNLISKSFSETKIEAISNIAAARNALAIGNVESARELIEQARGELDGEKYWHILNINCANYEDSAVYTKAVSDYASLFSNDPSWLLMGIDYYFLMGDFQKAYESIGGLDEKVGGDPVLMLLKANLKFSEGEVEESLKLITENLDMAGEISDFYYTKIGCLGVLGKYDDLVETLVLVYEKFGIEIGDIDYTGFEDFQDTKAFKDLMETQGYVFN